MLNLRAHYAGPGSHPSRLGTVPRLCYAAVTVKRLPFTAVATELPSHPEVSPLGIGARLALLDNVACGVWAFDGTDTRYVNQALCDITGYSREELLRPQFFQGLIHPDDVEMILERGRARVRGEDVPAQYEIRIIAQDGAVKTLGLDARRVELDAGPVSVVSATDVTRLRQAEQTIREGAATVIELLNAVPAHVITTNELGKPTFVNQHWLDFTGQSQEEAMETGTSRLIHPDDLEQASREWNEAKRTEQAYDINYRVRNKDGEYRWQNFRIAPVHDGSGKLLGWASASVDVEEEVQLRARLEAANDQLAEAMRAKDEVLGLISHELRTPLTTLLGNARLLKRRNDDIDAETRLAVVNDLEADAQRLYAVIENMLVLSRAGAAEEIELEPARLNRLAADVVAEFQVRCPGREVLYTDPGATPLALVNPTYYGQVLNNLLSNAHKYSPPEAPITVAVSVAGGSVETAVMDRGPGLSETELRQVFDAFYRSERHAHVTGIGLGLTVCQRLVELQGGTIRVRNRDGGGCEFTFTVPGAEPDALEAE